MTPTRPRLPLWLCLLGLAACAAPRPSSSTAEGPSEPATRIAELEAHIVQREAELHRVATDTEPDCAHVCMLVEQICTLAHRICDLAGQDAGLRPRCDDATARCGRARTVTAARCTCARGRP